MEPKYAILLGMCTDCKDRISDKQAGDVGWYQDKPKPKPDILDVILMFDAKFKKLQEEINDSLDKVIMSCLKALWCSFVHVFNIAFDFVKHVFFTSIGVIIVYIEGTVWQITMFIQVVSNMST